MAAGAVVAGEAGWEEAGLEAVAAAVVVEAGLAVADSAAAAAG